MNPEQMSLLSPMKQVPSWSTFPQECLECIVKFLHSDINSLLALMRVNRACFFLVVPLLYRDPFQLLAEIRDKNRIETIPAPPVPVESESRDASIIHLCSTVNRPQAPTSICHENREQMLIATLYATLLPDLCNFYPVIRSGMEEHNCYDLSPYAAKKWRHQQVIVDKAPSTRWTTDCYLRHLQVLNLEKMRHRGDSLGFLPSPCQYIHYLPLHCRGVLEHLQRGLLALHPENIRTLRIPVHRLKTFQLAHERVPRARSRPSRSLSTKQAHNLTMFLENSSLGDGGGYRINDNLRDVFTSEVQKIHASRAPRVDKRPPHTRLPYCFTFHMLSNLQRLEVYNMTQNPVNWMTLERVVATIQYGDHRGLSNEQSSQLPQRTYNNTLRELSIQSQSDLPAQIHSILSLVKQLKVLEIVGKSIDANGCLSRLESKQQESLRVLKVTHIQGITKIDDNHGDINNNKSSSNPDDRSLEHLARFKNLEELAITAMGPNLFRWCVDRKRLLQAKTREKVNIAITSAPLSLSIIPPSSQQQQPGVQQQQQQPEAQQQNQALSAPPVPQVPHEKLKELPGSEALDLHLSKLKHLTVHDNTHDFNAVVENICKAFADQLESLSLYFKINSSAGIHKHPLFSHPFRSLHSLTLRGLHPEKLDIACLGTHCLHVQILVLEHHPHVVHVYDEQENESMVKAMHQLSQLHTLHLEGVWHQKDQDLLSIAQSCTSLTMLGIQSCPMTSPVGLYEVHKELVRRSMCNPLGIKSVKVGVVQPAS